MPGSTTPTAGRSRSTPRSRRGADARRPRDPRAPLDGVRPGRRRSWWLREALAAEPASLAGDVAAPPLTGETRADVAILGGGYTGLWTTLRLTELAPGARIVVVESDICGGGASGRDGGVVSGGGGGGPR